MVRPDILQKFQRPLCISIIQIYKGVIQNNKWFRLLKECIHQRQSHTQCDDITLSGAEIRCLSCLTTTLYLDIQRRCYNEVCSAVQ